MYFVKPTDPKLAAAAALAFAMSGLAFHSWATFGGLPQLSELREATGQVVNAEKGRYGIRFGLQGVPEQFNYSSKGREVSLVHSALTRQERPRITVHYDPADSVGRLGTDEAFFQVLQISANRRIVRSRAQVEAAWRADEQVGLWLSIAFMITGGYFGRRAWRDEGKKKQ